LTKPFDIQALVDQVRHILSQGESH
jgi:DNA-binding response OmpR family regulator